MSETNDRVRRIIVEHLGADEADVLPATLLVPDNDGHGRVVKSDRPDLGCDSLDIVELVMAFEEEFEIAISDDEAEPLNAGTVQDVYDLVGSKLAA